jgi:hypothetical protein
MAIDRSSQQLPKSTGLSDNPGLIKAGYRAELQRFRYNMRPQGGGRRQHDHWSMGCRAEFFEELESAHARHVQIKRDEVGSAITDEGSCRRNVRCDPHDLAVRISIGDLLNQGPNCCRVVNDEQTYHMHDGRAFASARAAPERYRVICRLANDPTACPISLDRTCPPAASLGHDRGMPGEIKRLQFCRCHRRRGSGW